MRKTTTAVAALALSMVAVLGLSSKDKPSVPTHRDIAGQPALKVKADELKQTIVSPVLEQEIPPGKNVLWCSTFQLAWNELCGLLGHDVRWENAPPLVDALNRKGASKEDIDEASYVAMAGVVGDGIIGKIERALEEKFQGQADPERLRRQLPPLPADFQVMYAYLWKDLPFEWAFTRFRYPLLFGEAKVEQFGIEQLWREQKDEVRMAGQVTIFDYRNAEDFIVELRTKGGTDRLILAKVSPLKTLRETVESVRRRVAESRPTEMREMENLAVPVLDFDILRDYSEIRGGESGFVIAEQQVRFRLDEKGALLKSEATGLLGGSLRRFVFDKPFLILLQRKEARNPYFALWVANAELLVPFGRERHPAVRVGN